MEFFSSDQPKAPKKFLDPHNLPKDAYFWDFLEQKKASACSAQEFFSSLGDHQTLPLGGGGLAALFFWCLAKWQARRPLPPVLKQQPDAKGHFWRGAILVKQDRLVEARGSLTQVCRAAGWAPRTEGGGAWSACGPGEFRPKNPASFFPSLSALL